MIQTADKNMLDTGIYTPKQAARYARIKTDVMRRWVHGNKTGKPAIRAKLAGDPDNFVTFIDLIQAMAIRSMRLAEMEGSKKVSLPRVREVVEVAQNEYNLFFPFARKHTTYLFNDDIVLRLSDSSLIQVTGKYKKHQLIHEVVEAYADDLYFDESNLACSYVPMVDRNNKDVKVVLDPRIRLGEPTVKPGNYSVDALLTAIYTEGNARRAAQAYDVLESEVKLAQRYDDWLLGIAN